MHSLKYQRSTLSRCKDAGIRKLEFVVKTQFKFNSVPYLCNLTAVYVLYYFGLWLVDIWKAVYIYSLKYRWSTTSECFQNAYWILDQNVISRNHITLTEGYDSVLLLSTGCMWILNFRCLKVGLQMSGKHT